MISFCRFLRSNEYTVGPQEEAEVLEVLALLSTSSEEEFGHLLKAILAKDHYQYQRFDQLYTAFWKEYRQGIDAKQKSRAQESKKAVVQRQQAPSVESLKSWLHGNQSPDQEEIGGYSFSQVMIGKGLTEYADEHLEELQRLILKWTKIIATQYKRRFDHKPKGRRLAIRKTYRENIRRGGEFVNLWYQHKRKIDPKLVLLCDVSRSMDLYSMFLIQFIYAFQSQYKRIETFVFGTELHRVTEQFREFGFKQALRKLSEQIQDWSSGTRIGPSLESFLEQYDHKLDGRSLVIILSDGLDNANPELLSHTLSRISSKASKVLWLNPLAGNPDYQPLTQAMQSALPYIDELAPLYNIESLRDLIHKN
ncbi:MAG: VWA domain-containing protein [Bacteroidota bacterium]